MDMAVFASSPLRVWSRCCSSSPPTLRNSGCSRMRRIVCCSHKFDLSPITNKTLTAIQSSGVIACLRAQSAEMAMKAAQAALSGGISVLEIVMSSPGVFEVLQQLVQDYHCTLQSLIITHNNWWTVWKAGTVLNVKDAKLAVNAGAQFLLSPATVKDILDDVQGSEVLCIPGAMTPTEILSVYNAGAKIVKVYPISALGGSLYIATLKKPFSHIPLVASQGITLDLIGEYIAAGASSVVLSDAIFDKEAMAQQNFGAIYRSSQLAVLLANEAVKRERETRLIAKQQVNTN